jgi:hypothetical protein
VQLPGQPDGHSRHGGSAGCSDSDAVHTRNSRALDARLSYGSGWRHARTTELFQIDVQLGWRHPDPDAWANDGDDPLTPISNSMIYTFTLTPRMLAIALASLLALCVLLFLAGMEIGQKMAGSTIMANTANLSNALPALKAPKLADVEKLVAPLAPAKP